MNDCIFCRIVEKTIPANIIYEDEQIIAFHDIHPQTPVHILVIPKLHIASLADVTEEHAPLLGHLMASLPGIAKKQALTQGFRTIINTGFIGGQEVPHLHAHILGGSVPLPRMISPARNPH